MVNWAKKWLVVVLIAAFGAGIGTGVGIGNAIWGGVAPDGEGQAWLVFHDPQFAYQLRRTIGHTFYGGADIGECIATAHRITEGDFESWYQEWLKTADRVCAIADSCLADGHLVSAREAYLRASNYYRAAEFYLHGDPSDPRILETWGKSRDCFATAAELLPFPVEAVEIPYENTTIPGYLFLVDDSGIPRPTLILHTGYDGTLEELYFDGALAAVRRGYNCLAFEGPGQGRVIREQHITFRPDWENVVTPVVDYALTRPEVDPDRIALMGLSLGGYLAPRAAAYEHRIAACIANSGVYDCFENVAAGFHQSPEELKEYLTQDPSGFDEMISQEETSNTELRWLVEQGMWVFGVDSPHEWALTWVDYAMKDNEGEDIAHLITCPTLVCDSETDRSVAGQAEKLYDHLTCTKEYMLFTSEDAAEEHCQVGASALSHQHIFDWLDETFAELS